MENLAPGKWITDRLPTKADGDMDGDVRMMLSPGAAADHLLVHWSYIGYGAPWQHSSCWEPSAEPEPIGGSMISCRWDGPPPSPHSSVSGWFEQEGSKGILQGLRISALPSRGGSSTGFPEGQPSRAEKHSPELDRIAALEQRLRGLETLFWAHNHVAQPISIPSNSAPEAQS